MLLDTLHLLADGTLADNFFALSPKEETGEEEHWLFPFDPALLRLLDLDKMRGISSGRTSPVTCERHGSGESGTVTVRVEINGQTYSREYAASARNRDMVGNLLDVRIWPNFRFRELPLLPSKAADRVHVFRIRQMPTWGLRPKILARSEREVTTKRGTEKRVEFELFTPETNETGWPDEFDLFRLAKFYSFRSSGAEGQFGRSWEPIGLYFESRGLLLFRLEDPLHPGGEQAVPWRIGVDFGTSNTCVSFVRLVPGVRPEREPIHFSVQTSTMHSPPIYQPVHARNPGRDSEGASAVVDFPYIYDGSESALTEGSYFPTQFVTRRDANIADASFRLANGLTFPRNIVLDNRDIHDVLDGHPPYPAHDQRVFRVIHDVKKENRAYRKAFLWHLYKMVTLHAARCGAEIVEAAFSYPRAFDQDEIRAFSTQVRQIFADHGGIRVSAHDFLSESDAVQRWMAANPDREDHLVLDVGGGSADYLALLGNRARMQASYYCAASYINKCFEQSGCLRRVLRDAVYDVVEQAPPGAEFNIQNRQRLLLNDLLKGLNDLQAEQAGRSKSYSQQAFFGMLGMLNDRHYAPLSDRLNEEPDGDDPVSERRAICCFFYTLVLLYTGIVYQAGLLFRQANLSSTNLRVDFIGNGSRFFRFLERRSPQFESVIQEVFRAGYGRSDIIVRTRLDPSGKTFVAKGLLLRPQDFRRELFESAPVVSDDESVSYLRALNGRRTTAPAGIPKFEDLSEFLGIVGNLLPHGKLGGVSVIPFCEENWPAELQRLFPDIQEAVRRAESDSAERLAKNLTAAGRLRATSPAEAKAVENAALATEPVFITRLKCLLDQIREVYAV